MANFKTHISTSTMLGIGYGVGAWFLWDVPLQQCVIAAGLCSVAGMLPDLDSDTGIPVRETLCFLAAVIPALMIPRFHALGLTPEEIVFASVVIYIVFRFGVGAVFRKYTVHRGMWHSIPAAVIAGLATFVISFSPEFGIRLFKAWGVVMGFLCHLILDEIYSVDLKGRKLPRLKKSFGTALKFFGKSAWGNFSTYAKLALLVLICMTDATVMAFFNAQPLKLNVLSRESSEYLGELLPETAKQPEPTLR
jgi:membrane-bound metal-dependent hydrolase YbcI (DUF457 family)